MPLLASLLLMAQPVAAPEQAALAQCLTGFVAAQRQAGTPAADFTNALANACLDEERAYRAAYVAVATAAGASYVPADSAAYEDILALRIAQRSAFLEAANACARPARRR